MNYTPNSASKLIPSSKERPCLHCSKTDGWCYSIGDLTVCKRDNPPAQGWQATTKTDDEGNFYYAPIQEQKAVRPAQTRYWEYRARDGSPLVQVKRVDDGSSTKKITQQHWDGKGWVSGLGSVDKSRIPVYRYADIQKAMAKNEFIFIVEGEPCADLLWDLGLAATCNIGGSGKWQKMNSMDLCGAAVVICPDRDIPGVKHAELIYKDFPSAQWLYPYPDSPAWDNLPKSQGLDIADWIESGKLANKKILEAIGEKRTLKTTPGQESKIVTHPKFEQPDLSTLAAEIDQLLSQDLKRSELKIKILGLSQKFRISDKEVWNLYKTREDEQEQADSREDIAAEVKALLKSKNSQINIAEIIPPGLAAPIAELAARLNLKPECYLTTLLTQVSSLFKVGSEVKLRNDTNYRVTPNYFAGIVAESSQKKSPIMREIIDRPMQALRDKARKEFEKAYEAYEQKLASWKASKGDDKGPAPKVPRQKLYSFSKTTGEGILYQVAEHPDQGLMYRCDELASLFKSANQYRGGKGSDDEDLLEYWNGTGSTVLRASGVKADLDGLLLSVFGTIQPDVLAALLKDCSDSNGKFARFDFVIQPLAASKLSLEDSGSFDLTPMLSSLYQKIDALPALKLELDTDAKRYFTQFYNAAEDKRVAEPMQGKRAMIGKAPEKVGKLAVVIHALNCVFSGQPVTTHIPKDVIKAAVKFVMFTASQIDVLYTEFSDRTALAPNLVKILALAERKGGAVSVRDVSACFTSKYRPTGGQVREWFNELASMKYGEVTSKGKIISFTLYPHPHLPTLDLNPETVSDYVTHTTSSNYPHLPTDNPSSVGKCGQSVGNITHTLNSLPHKTLSPSVGSVGKKTPPFEKSNPLMMSCTTENSAKNPKTTREFEESDRVVVSDRDSGIYKDAVGIVLEVWYGRNGQELRIEFDKKVRGVAIASFTSSQLMKL